MFDIGWTELLVIAIVLIVVVGPEDLPRMLRAFGKATARMRSMAGEFRTQFDEALKEADLEDVRKTIADARSLNPAQHLRDAINPLRQVGDEIRTNLSDAVRPDSITKPAADGVPDPLPAVDTVSAAMNGSAAPAASPVPVEVSPAAPKPAPKRKPAARKTAAPSAAPAKSRTGGRAGAAKPPAKSKATAAAPKRASAKAKAAPAEQAAPAIPKEKIVKAKTPRASRARSAAPTKPAGPAMPNGADEADRS